MKKHLILQICLFSFLAATFFNCSEPTPPAPRSSTGTSIAPRFEGSGSQACEFENLTRDFVRVSSRLGSAGNAQIIQHGHVWSSEMAFPLLNEKLSDGLSYSELGEASSVGAYPYRFTSYVKGLKAGTTYYVRAYVTTKDGTYYGDPSQFKTLDDIYN